MRILVCGGRDYFKYSKVTKVLTGLLDDVWHEDEDTIVTIIQGGASGADFIAKIYALDFWGGSKSVKHEEYPADWKEHGKAAGMIRNKQMLEEGKPDLVVAFPGGKGTENMVQLATAAGIKVLKIE